MAKKGETASTSVKLRGEDKIRQVVSALQHDIIFGRLKPRERLIEEELSERFDAGRHVIRAAIEELGRLGLVQRRANKGAVVSDLSRDEVNELYDVRILLQREAARLIPLPGAQDLVRDLEEINGRFRQHALANELREASTVNDEFHQLFYGACGNRHLAKLVQEYWLMTSSIHSYAIGSPELAHKSYEEHKDIIDALAKGDRERLVRLCVDHMMPALEAFKAAHGGWEGA